MLGAAAVALLGTVLFGGDSTLSGLTVDSPSWSASPLDCATGLLGEEVIVFGLSAEGNGTLPLLEGATGLLDEESKALRLTAEGNGTLSLLGCAATGWRFVSELIK